jgi:hypothetical protein
MCLTSKSITPTLWACSRQTGADNTSAVIVLTIWTIMSSGWYRGTDDDDDDNEGNVIGVGDGLCRFVGDRDEEVSNKDEDAFVGDDPDLFGSSICTSNLRASYLRLRSTAELKKKRKTPWVKESMEELERQLPKGER